MKLKMMRRQMWFRRGILAREWEHASARMKLRHMENELASYRRLKISKELQKYLKDKELGVTTEQVFVRMEKENEATNACVSRRLSELIHQTEEQQVQLGEIEAITKRLDDTISELKIKVSEKRLHEDPFQPIRTRRIYRKRMDIIVQRSRLIRQVQANHSKIILLQTELELLRLKTYPTLATFRTLN